MARPDPHDPPLDAPVTRARLERLLLLARRTRREVARGRREPGRGVEPGARRPYAPGDDPRSVDWPAYARLEQLLVKVPEAVPPARLALVLDASASADHGAPAPRRRARLAVAARAVAALARGVRVDLLWGLAHLRLDRPSELTRALRFLAQAPSAGPAFPGVRALGGAGRGELCLVGDGLDPEELVAAAREARARGWTPTALLIESAAEAPAAVREAAAAASRVQLVDAEGGAVRWTTAPLEAWSAAAEARAARLREAEARLLQARVPVRRLAAAAAFEAPALEWLGA
ncbi:MAG: DUF58 domain-containing protein [Planctomycetota bacterium]